MHCEAIVALLTVLWTLAWIEHRVSALEAFNEDESHGPNSALSQKSTDKIGQYFELPIEGSPSSSSLTREKRQAAGDDTDLSQQLVNFQTKFDLKHVKGDVNTMKVGDTIMYKLDVLLPRKSNMNLHLEIFTKDFEDNEPPNLALYDVHVAQLQPGIEMSPPTLHPKMYLSDQVETIFDRAVLKFDQISNAGRDGNKLVIGFSVVAIRNPNSTLDKPSYVTVGAEYNSASNVWVGQSEIKFAQLTQEEEERHAVVTVSHPETIALDSAAMITFHSVLIFRSDIVTLEIESTNHEAEDDNLLSTGKIGMTFMGFHFRANPNDSSHYISHSTERPSKLSFGVSTLDMGVVTNVGPASKQSIKAALNNRGNNITFVASVYATNFDWHVGQTASVKATIRLGKQAVWSKDLQFTITPRIPTTELKNVKVVQLARTLTPNKTPPGSLVTVMIEAVLDQGPGFTDLELTVELQKRAQTILIDPCFAKMIKHQTGFNVPYVSSAPIESIVDPRRQFATFKFDRIHVLHMRNASKPAMAASDNLVTIEVAMRVVMDEANSEGRILAPRMSITDGMQRKQELDAPFIEIIRQRSVSSMGRPEFKLEKANPWKYDLYLGGSVAVNIVMQFPRALYFDQFKLFVQPDNETVSHRVASQLLDMVKICRLQLHDAGDHLPCLQARLGNINLEHAGHETDDEGNNATTLSFGDLTVFDRADSAKNSLEKRATVSMVVTLDSSAQFKGSAVPFTLRMIAMGWTHYGQQDEQSHLLWSKPLKLSLRKDTPAKLAPADQPQLSARATSDAVWPGLTTTIDIDVDTKPMSISHYEVDVVSLGLTGDDGKVLIGEEGISVCGVWILEVGENIPCVNTNLTKISYDEKSVGHKIKGTIDFNALTNVGSSRVLSMQEQIKANRIRLRAQIRISSMAKENRRVKHALVEVRVRHGSPKGFDTIKAPVSVPIARSQLPAGIYQDPAALSLSAANNVERVSLGSPTLFYVDLELRPNSITPFSFQLKDFDRYFEICDAKVIHIGQNYPCFAPDEAMNDFRKGRFDLGVICNTYLHSNDNLVRLALAVRFKEDLEVGQKVTVEGLAKVGHGTEKVLSTVVQIDDQAPSYGLRRSAIDLKPMDPTPRTIAIRQSQWMKFGLKLPPNSVSGVRLEAEGATKNGRAIQVITGFQMVSGGRNIPCIGSPSGLTFKSTLRNSQNNLMTVNLARIANFGFSHSLNESGQMDDIIVFEVEAQFTDHPNADPRSDHPLTVRAILGDFPQTPGDSRRSSQRDGQGSKPRQMQVETIKMMRVERHDDEKTALDINLSIISEPKPVYDRNDEFIVFAKLRHEDDSTAEPEYARLKLFLPPYVSFGKVIKSNTKFHPTVTIPSRVTHTACEILFPAVLFSDVIEVNFTLVVDPKNIRGYGRTDPLFVATPYRVICEQLRSKSLSQIPCSPMKHVSYKVKSSECDEPLGLSTNQISDCQITASTAINRYYAPQFARLNGRKMWSPALTSWTEKQYLQIDFLRMTRIARVQLQSVSGARRVTKVSVWSSNDRKSWYKDAKNQGIAMNYNRKGYADHNLGAPVQARFIRVVVDNTTWVEEAEKDSLIGVRMELFGCYLEENDQEECSADDTWYSNDEKLPIGRHFTVDSKRNIVYVCDTMTNLMDKACFFSDNGGQTWHSIPSINELVGYDVKNDRVVGINSHNRVYMSSRNGLDWTVEFGESLNETLSNSDSRQMRVAVANQNRDNLLKLNLKQESWKATYDGLHFDESEEPKLRWTRCCGDQ